MSNFEQGISNAELSRSQHSCEFPNSSFPSSFESPCSKVGILFESTHGGNGRAFSIRTSRAGGLRTTMNDPSSHTPVAISTEDPYNGLVVLRLNSAVEPESPFGKITPAYPAWYDVGQARGERIIMNGSTKLFGTRNLVIRTCRSFYSSLVSVCSD